MTKLTYDIVLNGRTTVKNVPTYKEACDMVEKLGKGFTHKAHYEEFDPFETPETLKTLRTHAEKAQEAFARKHYEKELAHAPAYVNISGVGAS